MIAEAIQRLRAVAMPPLQLVQGAAEFAALASPPPIHLRPAAYVLPLGFSAGPNSLVNLVRQRGVTTIGVVILHSSLRDGRGENATVELDEICASVRRAMQGFQPRAECEPFELGDGALLDVADGVVAWRETFVTAEQWRG